MIILGLHFGHDAGVSVIKDGEIISAIERERVCRVKHAATLDTGQYKSLCRWPALPKKRSIIVRFHPDRP